MKEFFRSRFFFVLIAIIVIAVIVFMALEISKKSAPAIITTVVETGTVRELVSVSGIAKAEQTAELAFPTTGVVKEVLVRTGDEVKVGDSLVTLDSRGLEADKAEAEALLTKAKADLSELLNGPTISARNVTDETLTGKERYLQTIINDETQKIRNAYNTLLSTDLRAYSTDAKEDAIPPIISGTYNCGDEGVYILDMFSSKASSGYSYKLSGLEDGTDSVYTDQSSPLGMCGLRIQFDADSKYDRGQWQIEIPNTKSSSYVTNKNAYSLAIVQSESAITNARQSLSLTKTETLNKNAPPRSEAIARANADIIQALARITRIDTSIADRTLTAPFSGVITNIDIVPGETVTVSPVVTLLASSEFEVTARIPEIDVGKILVGQKVNMLFDAKNDEILNGEIRFISPRATEIDGVAYYEAFVKLDRIPDWIRSGLNADIDIIITENNNVLRVPKRFVIKTETGHEVLLSKQGIVASSTVEIKVEGNDGFFAINGLNEGDILVAP